MSRKTRFDKMIDQLTVRKTQLMAAGVMLVLAAGPIASAYFYVPEPVMVAEPVQAALLPETSWEAETTLAAPETTEAKADYVPTPGELNLAHYFPEGADQSKMTESLAGQAFKVLMTHDENWMSNIYDMADATPLQMAKALGKSKGSVQGSYNYKDELHDPKNPDTWTVNSFKRVRMSFTNGDGQPVSAYSNVIDIMSMANLYTYFKGVEDYDLFLSYAQTLWDKSHSYTVGISSLYHCDGCLDEDAERREYEELEAEAKAEEEAGAEALVGTDSASGAAEVSSAQGFAGDGDRINPSGPSGSPAAPADSQPAPASALDESGTTVIVAGSTREVEETTTAAVPQETVPESTAGVIVAGQAVTQAGNEALTLASAEGDESMAAETAGEASAPAAVADSAADSSADTGSTGFGTEESVTESDLASATPADAEMTTKKKTVIKCPGHIDLIVNVKVIGLKEENGLFGRDIIGNDSANIEEDGWPGWNNYTMASAKLLSNQDWFDKYGLSLSVISMRNPLTESEIDSYLNQLPVGLSQTRKDLIQFALSSVGKVPYYWGGKPSAPNYAGNSFGVYTAPDQKGRVLRGLDCSGWINWVYWSVTGQRLPYESTSGLAISGTRISRSELQPGDIIVRTGTDAHVIMFLGWTADGKIRCIHESSAGVNNVTVAIRDAHWPYYRKLVD